MSTLLPGVEFGQFVPEILTQTHFNHLEGGDVSAVVDGVPAGERGVGGRALGHRHGEEERLLAARVHALVVHLHSVEQLLREVIDDSRKKQKPSMSATWQTIVNWSATYRTRFRFV